MTPLATQTIFYTIERSIKEYRRLAQRNLNKKLDNITIDQALVLTFLDKYPKLSQNEIANLIFKDNASVTRMIDLMTKKNYLKRSVDTKDRRKHILNLTDKGNNTLRVLNAVISNNRKATLKGISNEELKQLEQILNKIITNCNN